MVLVQCMAERRGVRVRYVRCQTDPGREPGDHGERTGARLTPGASPGITESGVGASLTPGASPGITESGSVLCGLEQWQEAVVPLRLQALDRKEAQRRRVDAVA